MDTKSEKLAIFDFDGTITKKDSFNDFLIYKFGKKKFYITMIKNSIYILAYLFGKYDNSKIKSRIFKSFYHNKSYDEYKEDSKQYSLEKMPDIIKQEMIKKIEMYKHKKIEVIILSASFKEWIEPWASLNGINKIICSTFELNDNIIEGTINFEKNCYGLKKVEFLKENYNNLEDCYIYAYGDSKSDKYYMELADERFWC